MGYSLLNFSRFLTRLQRFAPAGGTVKYAPVLCRLWAFDAGAGIEPTSKLLGLHHTFVLLCCGLLTARRASDFSSIGKSAFRHTKLLVAGHGVEPHSKGIDPPPLPNPAVLFPAIVLPPGGAIYLRKEEENGRNVF